MTDIAAVVETVETSLTKVAREGMLLATGLQNAALAGAPPSKSVQYLLEITEAINETAEKIRQINTQHQSPRI